MGLRGELELFRVGSLPTIFYIPDYLNSQEQDQLLHQVNIASSMKWKTLKNRRLQNWGGVVHEKGLLPQELPQWLSDLTGKICKDLGLYPKPINHVLINEYLPGQGIMPHQDGPAYFPTVSIVSLGSPALIRFTPHQRLLNINQTENASEMVPVVSLVLAPGSLLVFKDLAYEDYLHGIDDCTEHELDETVVNLNKLDPLQNMSANSLDASPKVLKRDGARVSLTCRLVTKVHKNLFKF